MDFDVSEIVITKAEREDLREILDLQYLAFLSEVEIVGTTDISPLKQTLAELCDEYERSTVIKMLLDGRIIGSVRFRNEGDTVYVGKLMVHPDYRRHGLGARLLNEADRLFPGKRYELFTCDKCVNTIRLYEKNGYVKTGKSMACGSLNFIYMERNANPQS